MPAKVAMPPFFVRFAWFFARFARAWISRSVRVRGSAPALGALRGGAR
jgi:hypothetical protein